MPLGGKTVIEQVISRVKKSNIDEAILVTSIDRANLPMVELCAKNNIRVFVGSENDVLDRFYQAAKLIKPEYVIRITGDCPMFDYTFLDRAIHELKKETDYLAPISETFPDGLDLEIMKYSVLEQSWKEARLASEREHVTMYIKNNCDKFLIQDFICDIKDIQGKRWTLDEEDDYKLISSIYNHFTMEGNELFLTKDILEYLRINPELEKVNSKYSRNEGLQKSLKEDYLIQKQ